MGATPVVDVGDGTGEELEGSDAWVEENKRTSRALRIERRQR